MFVLLILDHTSAGHVQGCSLHIHAHARHSLSETLASASLSHMIQTHHASSALCPSEQLPHF